MSRYPAEKSGRVEMMNMTPLRLPQVSRHVVKFHGKSMHRISIIHESETRKTSPSGVSPFGETIDFEDEANLGLQFDEMTQGARPEAIGTSLHERK